MNTYVSSGKKQVLRVFPPGNQHPVELDSIDKVIDVLEEIIVKAQMEHDPLGYFAVLYQKVTRKVKEGIENEYFDNGPRMEQLDIVFAERYLKAYFAYKRNLPVTASWERAFDISLEVGPIVLQHLLVGINAHINLDLGIAAAEVSKDQDIDDLKDDFERINNILSTLVDEVEESLVDIIPFFGFVIRRAGRLDNFLVDLIIRMARNGAWRFAKKIVQKSGEEWEAFISKRDRQTARIASFIGNPNILFTKILQMIGMLERGSVSDKIKSLKFQTCTLSSL